MSLNDRFMAYASAFEEAYASDDWSKIDPFFTEDAVYETFADEPFGNRTEGRAAIKTFFKQSVDLFDRRFDSRAVEMVAGPEERNGTVWMRWVLSLTLAGAPDLRMEGEETAVFQGDRICRLEDRIPAESTSRTLAYVVEHDTKLKPAPGP